MEVRQRRREEAAATRERVADIRRKMREGESWQTRVNSLLALLYPCLLLLLLGLAAYCCYLYTTLPARVEEVEEVRGGILEEVEEVEDILAE